MSREHDPVARAALIALGVVQLALGVWMALAPGVFFEVVAPFGARNDHLLRDMASWELALAVLAFAAAARPAWRVPVVALALMHFALHALNHLVDVGGADPGWVGPADLASLVVGAGGLAWLLTHVQRSAA